MNKIATITVGMFFSFVLSLPCLADGITSWSPDQFKQPKHPQNLWGNGNICRFNHSVNSADMEFEDQSWEASDYWVEQARNSRHDTVSYLVDLGDLYHRMDQPVRGLSYYHMAHNMRRKTVEDNLELGMAFLDANRPGMANYYFKAATKFARSKSDWTMIHEAFTKLGNVEMAQMAMTHSKRVR